MLIKDGYLQRVSVRSSIIFNWSQTEFTVLLDLWAETIARCVKEIVRQGDVDESSLFGFAGLPVNDNDEGFQRFYDFYIALLKLVAEPKRRIVIQHCNRLFSACFYRVLWIGSVSTREKASERRDELIANWSTLTERGLEKSIRSLMLIRKDEVLEYLQFLKSGDEDNAGRYKVNSRSREVMLDENAPVVGLEGKLNSGMLKPITERATMD